MIIVIALSIGIWAYGSSRDLPVPARLIIIGLLLCVVVAIHLILPEGHALREVLGGDPSDFMIALLGGIVISGYLYGFRRLKTHVRPENAVRDHEADPNQMSGAELERYARHIVLREIGGPGQMALREAKVLVIGAGGLGSPVLQYLAGAGVGTIGIIDPDTVSASNLQRQVIFREGQEGMPKVFAAAEALDRLNPFITVRPYNRPLTAGIAEELFADYDLIIDGCDSFETRTVSNRAAVARGLPLVSGAITQWEGQVGVFDGATGPCYACAFPTAPDPALLPTCAEAGVAGPLPGIIGSIMAMEAVKMITGAGDPLMGRILIYDALYAETRTLRLTKSADCPVCAAKGAPHDQPAA